MDGEPSDPGRSLAFNIVDDPVVTYAAAEFTSGFEAGTLSYFDRVLPHCDRMIDFGAYIGFTALHAASHGVEVHAFEPNPVAYDLLARNVAANPNWASRMHLFRYGIGPRDEEAMLFAKAYADSGASVHQIIERGSVVQTMPAAKVRLREAVAVLREIGVERRALLKNRYRRRRISGPASDRGLIGRGQALAACLIPPVQSHRGWRSLSH